MGKKLTRILAIPLIASSLAMPSYAGPRGRAIERGMGGNWSDGISAGIGESMGKAFTFGYPKPASINPEEKREHEAVIFRMIVNYSEKNPNEGSRLARKIVETPDEYHSSMADEEKNRFNDFMKKVDAIDVKGGKLLDIYQYHIRWPMIRNNLDIVELLILYNIYIMENNIETLKQSRDYNRLKIAEKTYFDFKGAIAPPGTPGFKGSNIRDTAPAPAPQSYKKN